GKSATAGPAATFHSHFPRIWKVESRFWKEAAGTVESDSSFHKAGKSKSQQRRGLQPLSTLTFHEFGKWKVDFGKKRRRRWKVTAPDERRGGRKVRNGRACGQFPI